MAAEAYLTQKQKFLKLAFITKNSGGINAQNKGVVFKRCAAMESRSCWPSDYWPLCWGSEVASLLPFL